VLLGHGVSREVLRRPRSSTTVAIIAHGEPLHENPSPGNIASGIDAEEKSLRCAEGVPRDVGAAMASRHARLAILARQ
jgi:hypothetical protein